MTWAWLLVVSSSICAVSLIVMAVESIRHYKWARRKAAEETLYRLVFGEFPQALDEIGAKFSWNPINDKNSYKSVIEGLEETKKRELDRLLRRVLRILETVFIQVRHGTLPEAICHDYLLSIGPAIYHKSKEFVEEERRMRNERRVFENLEFFVNRWQQMQI